MQHLSASLSVLEKEFAHLFDEKIIIYGLGIVHAGNEPFGQNNTRKFGAAYDYAGRHAPKRNKTG
ncbi:MAG TPA: hypothetical protein IAA64_00385 [Candidatus Ornithocaccomicrobium faecavium]|uniref:Uncharacterized protein n=1 Tax=Candidatus Ornithocaccomicrobium faecavium TaxID=2840890 RepID=A0A9D1TBR3_9FIRM|nr:hypothetical protein [Candidatus Ornithocaccomicrobium faecavium]